MNTDEMLGLILTFAILGAALATAIVIILMIQVIDGRNARKRSDLPPTTAELILLITRWTLEWGTTDEAEAFRRALAEQERDRLAQYRDATKFPL